MWLVGTWRWPSRARWQPRLLLLLQVLLRRRRPLQLPWWHPLWGPQLRRHHHRGARRRLQPRLLLLLHGGRHARPSRRRLQHRGCHAWPWLLLLHGRRHAWPWRLHWWLHHLLLLLRWRAPTSTQHSCWRWRGCSWRHSPRWWRAAHIVWRPTHGWRPAAGRLHHARGAACCHGRTARRLPHVAEWAPWRPHHHARRWHLQRTAAARAAAAAWAACWGRIAWQGCAALLYRKCLIPPHQLAAIWQVYCRPLAPYGRWPAGAPAACCSTSTAAAGPRCCTIGLTRARAAAGLRDGEQRRRAGGWRRATREAPRTCNATPTAMGLCDDASEWVLQSLVRRNQHPVYDAVNTCRSGCMHH
jgi:hypothetical protein